MNRYSLIYADPAWSYGNTISNGAAVDHYPTMSLLDMKRLPVWELAADNAVLAMWYTGTHNQEAIELAEAWGFTVRTMKGFTWVKLNQLAELRITKALAEGEIADFYDFLDLLNAETRMNGGNHTRANTDNEQHSIAISGCGHEHVSTGREQDPAASAGLRGDYRPLEVNGFWRDADWLLCRDGKWRPVEPGTFPLVDGAAARMGRVEPGVARVASSNRVGRLKGYGNAINAQAAAAFIRAYMGVV